jgi:hypothetical protein
MPGHLSVTGALAESGFGGGEKLPDFFVEVAVGVAS